jgi:8-oxo-dGTP pyrophosphatase MutT (NUDIX family)
MTISTEHIRRTVADYLSAHPDDEPNLSPLLTLLDEAPDVTDRKEFRGHVTAGAVLVDEEGRVLHIHHNALNKWLLPGGHAEAEDSTLSGVALRELVEEAGLDGAAIALMSAAPLHIDVHEIPASDAKGEPAHFHADFRFAFRLDRSADVQLQEEEVSAYAWRPAEDIADETLRGRVTATLAAV